MIKHHRLLWLAGVLLAAPFTSNNAHAVTFPVATLPDGVCVNTGAKYNLTDQDMQMAVAAGVKYLRIDMKWGWVEQARGVRNWTDFDTLTTRMSNFGLKPLFMVAYGNPRYGTADSTTMNELDEQQGYASFAAEAVSRYDEPGVIWELWNEQNTGKFWGVTVDGNQDTGVAATERAKNYMAMVDLAVPAMRAASPACTIISGGVLNPSWNVSTAWFQECFNRGLLTKVDGLGVHYYGGSSNLNIERVPTEIINFRKFIVANGGPADFPVLNSEFGVQTIEFGGALSLQQHEQAALCVRSFLMTRIAGVRLSCWYEWRTGGTMSLLESNFAVRPAYTALLRMNTELQNYTYENRRNIGSPDDHALVFQNGSQRRLVIWTTDAPHNVSIPVTGGTSFTTRDLLGNAGSIPVVNGHLNLSLNGRPIYVDLGTNQIGTTISDTLSTQDIGPVGMTGAAGVRDGKYWLRGSGADIYGNADQFRFCYKPVTGNVTITARVLSLGSSHTDARSGVMFRETLDPSARHASLFVTPAGKAQLFRRTTAGGTTAMSNLSTVSPHWVRIVRNNDLFSCYRSEDGVNWGSPVGTVTLSNAAQTMYIGLVSCAHTNSQITTAVYDNVTPDLGGGSMPAVQFDPYQRVEAEAFTAQKGLTRYVGASYNKMGLAHNGDWLEFARTDFGSGALNFTARVSSETAAGGTIQVRLGSPTGTLVGSLAVSPTGNWENFVDVQTTITGATGLQDLYLVYSGGTGYLLDLDYFQFEPIDPEPAMISEDIGSPAMTGNASVSNGVFTVQGGGLDIWSNSDQFRFVHHSMTGDGEIVARVDSLVDGDANAKAGVMMRATTAAKSAYAYVHVTPANGLWYQRRLETLNAYSSTVASTTGAAPTWVRLVRSGNLFRSYLSTNGTTWTQLGAAQTINMPQTIEVGLAVTSKSASAVATAIFSNVETTY